ncbi:hypothetical protein K438DRAFT_1818553 [Mycena galopus ATCC 62051]|nr:hypothetical protein K438DRAFT_1818553 [Mycena galopus ATCC 62051]
MLFSSPLVVAALMAFSVGALPKADCDDDSLIVPRATCKIGHYPNPAKNNACTICPPGSTCDGTSISQCGTGHAQPKNGTSGECPQCPAGTYQPNLGATSCILCGAGSYQPYPAQSYCPQAPSGWFQSQSGKSFMCGTCCGWEAMSTGNVIAKKCKKPNNAWPNSGSGCTISPPATCMAAKTCAQDPVTGACPAGSVTKSTN